MTGRSTTFDNNSVFVAQGPNYSSRDRAGIIRINEDARVTHDFR